MSTDQGPVVQSALLRTELVSLRKEKGLTQEQVARRLEWSPSKLIRVEGGKNAISRTDLQALLQQYDVTAESRQERLQALARGAREPAWWNQYRGETSDVYINYIGYEAGASFIRDYQLTVIPGMLQTREYAEIIATGRVNALRVGPVVKLRMERQRRMAERENPPRRYHIIDEAVIRRHVGIAVDPAIMPEQLRHVADACEADDLVTVRIIPFSIGSHVGLRGSFTLLEFESGLGDALYQEGGRTGSGMSFGEESGVIDYRDAFEDLLEISLSAAESIELLRSAAEELMD
ncbi:helix-turn-helix domain-containing protein [Actinomadura flavalba]|uniref:helix-turn-helix domain-containing protein n=1 Tax=Actinomadura flavalba TaxID=1120938 RepID=UPI00035DCB13|nr:helix-turn-helix transcriptional regulator [Actinomadura flavalba]